jgi:uncharacterized protein (TIGR02466 family)
MIQAVFATPVYKSDNLYHLTKEQLDYLKTLEMIKNKGGNFLTTRKDIMNDESMKDFKHWCLLNVTAFAKQLGASDKTSFYITQSWMNKNPPQSYHHTHMHPNSIFSCIFYVDGDKCPTSFYRYDDRTSFGNFAFYDGDKGSNVYTATKVGVMNEVGRLVIFPSSMVHDVDKNESAKDRLTISFNTFIKGEMGDPENSNHLII